eukprot:TRINITY_DN4465_c0_g1_i1.p1 TRINITY_DN4465_c0_g1~~TRINITY_DN4465_c0_g1_i1.p1  ORF type:complete len:482 (-),score=141.18 TRINITY_DN4465_c0_g1_i1:504-1949(-)
MMNGLPSRSLSAMSVESVVNDSTPVATSSRKRKLRAMPSRVEACTSLEALLMETLPDKAALHAEWLQALAQPSVCLTTIDDIERLDAEDITTLPVPPLVKGVFRDVLNRVHAKEKDQQDVLHATVARKKAFLAPLKDRNMQPALAGSKYFQDVRRYKLILAREEIEACVKMVAHRVETWAKGERIILVGILKGAFMFMSDLCRALVRPYSVYFVEASSYKDGKTQGNMEISATLSASKFMDATSKKPHKIVLIDELLDNGKTMQDMKMYFLKMLDKTHTEKDIVTCCLFSKKRERQWPEADITGIPNLPDLWLVGYGLDDRGTKRGWTDLFAMPKVKIVDAIEKEEIDRLLANLNEDAVLSVPMVFNGFELASNHKQRYRLIGLDAHGEKHAPSLQMSEHTSRVTSKGDVLRLLAGLSTVKGKYEQEVQLSFIQENQHLVPEDEIFSGNNQVYAELRCRLRRQMAHACERFGLPGPAEVTD